jgi:xylulokinase
LGHLYKAVLEGIGLEYGVYCKILKQLYPSFKFIEIRITGGGEKSQVWNRLKANILQIPVVQLTRTEGAPMGVAMLAGYGVGLFKNLDSIARKWGAKGASYTPDKKLKGFYVSLIKKYEYLLKGLSRYYELK